MSNYNLKAKRKSDGEIVDFYAIDNYFGHHRYGYEENNNTFKSNPIKNRVLKESEFDELYEPIIQDNYKVIETGNDKMSIAYVVPNEDPNHPYGGMETWRDRLRSHEFTKFDDETFEEQVNYDEIENFFQQELERICEEVEKKSWKEDAGNEVVLLDDIISIIKK